MVRPVLLATLGLYGCGPVSFGTTLSGSTTVPGGNPMMMLAALPLIGPLSNLDFDKNPDFMRQGVKRADLVSAKVQQATLRLTQPPSADFSWLDELQLVATSGGSEVVFADELGISGGVPPLDNALNVRLTPTNDVTAQVAQASLSFVMRGKGRQPAGDTQVELTLALAVQANPPAR